MILKTPPTKPEFVTLMALMTSLVALAIDAMLPAFKSISQTFSLSSNDQSQLIVAILFLGFGFGQMIFGPLSDVFGRKPPIYVGLLLFMLGSIFSGFAESFELFILGRFLQGFGGAAPRIVSLALIRDEYEGNAMAQITSLVMTVFILVPAIAPTLGQAILVVGSWRQIFIVLFVMALIIWTWFGLRQPETLLKENRKKFSHHMFMVGVKETMAQPTTVACMLISGLIFGIFVGYLGAVQIIFADLFQVTDLFPLFFAILALSIGGASFFNSRLVMALGIRKLLRLALFNMAALALFFLGYLSFFQQGSPPLWLFMLYMVPTFFSVGFLFGNLNALAMTPLGHIAGVGSALLGFVQSSISVVIGVGIGRFFYDDIKPLVLSFAIVSLLSLTILQFERRCSKTRIP